MEPTNKEIQNVYQTIKHQKKTTRVGWIDATKGIGIILVVFGHVLGGAISRNWFGPEQQGQYLYDVIYLFHMPLFFLISGVVWIESARANPMESIFNSFRTIAWPYVFWSLVQQLSIPVVSRFAPNATYSDFSDWIGSLISGKVYWFLWTLFVIQISIAPISKFPLGLLFAGSLLILGWTLNANPYGTFYPVLRNLPFFLAGTVFAQFFMRFHYSTSRPLTIKMLLGSAAMFGILVALKSAGLKWPTLIYLLGGGIGSLAVILFVLSLKLIPFQTALQTIGTGSLAIYVSHSYFQGASREIFIRLFEPYPYLVTLLITITSVIGPLIILHLSRKYGFTWIYRFPVPGHVPTESIGRINSKSGSV